MSELTIAEEEEEGKSGSSDCSEEPFPDTSIQLQHISGDRYAIYLLIGRCYEAEIYTVLLPLRCAIAFFGKGHFQAKIQISAS